MNRRGFTGTPPDSDEFWVDDIFACQGPPRCLNGFSCFAVFLCSGPPKNIQKMPNTSHSSVFIRTDVMKICIYEPPRCPDYTCLFYQVLVSRMFAGGCAQSNSKEVSHAMRILSGNCLRVVSELEITRTGGQRAAGQLLSHNSSQESKRQDVISIQLHQLIPICCLLYFYTILHKLGFGSLTCNRLPSFFWGHQDRSFPVLFDQPIVSLILSGRLVKNRSKCPTPFVRRIA